jgi:hypothetical protein
VTSPSTLPDWNAFGGEAISGLTNPEAAMAATQQVLADAKNIPRPQITPPSSRHLILQHGILRGGTWHCEAELRELNGADEEAIEAAGGDELKAFETALVRGVVGIGAVEMNRQVASELIMGEREELLLAVRRATFGDFVEYKKLPCANCGELTDLDYHLDDLPVRRMEDPQQEFYEVPLAGGAVARVRIPNGADQAHAMKMKGASAAKVNSEMLNRCVLGLRLPDGVQEVRNDFAQRMSMADRRVLVRWLVQSQPGPQYGEAVWTHETCGEEVPLPINLGVLFRGF